MAFASSPPTKSPKSSTGWGSRWVKTVQKSLADGAEARRLAKEAKEAGKVWDAEKNDYVFYFIDQELEEVEKRLAEKQAEEKKNSESAEERPVADREYYDLLDVSTSADDATIRKAYFKAARKCHPDKNPDDPDAHAKFQQLGHAYQILSKPESRAHYDKHGKPEDGDNNAAEANLDEVDPFVFFNVMFGSTLVEPYIGELGIASTLDSVMKADNLGDEELEQLPEEERLAVMEEQAAAMEEKAVLTQRARELKCAQNLRTRIAEFDPQNPEPFCQSAQEEARQIAAGAYGALYLSTIGFCLAVNADEFLGFEKGGIGSVLQGHVARSRKNASNIGSGFKMVGAVVKAAGAGSRAMSKAEQMQKEAALREEAGQEQAQELNEQEAAQFMSETIDGSLPAFLELAWAFNKRDIQVTLHEVCKKLFQDASVPKELRLVRAKAVRKLGREFRAVGKAHKATAKDHFQPEDIKARVAVATMTTMAKAQGQEVNEEDAEEMIRQAKEMSSFEDEQQQTGMDSETTASATDQPPTNGILNGKKDAKTSESAAATTKTDAHNDDLD